MSALLSASSATPSLATTLAAANQAGPGLDAAAPANADESVVSAWLTELHYDWSELTAGYRRRALVAEERLFLEGQAADWVYVLEQGRVRLTSDSVEGRERHLMIIGAKGLLGDCGIPVSSRYVMSATAVTDSLVVALPIAEMLTALTQHPLLARQHQALAAMRFRIMLQHVALQGANSAKRRVSHHLLGLLNSYGQPHSQGSLIGMPFTQQEMGSICGLSRVSVSTIFSQLESAGILGREGRLILVRDLPRLRRLASS